MGNKFSKLGITPKSTVGTAEFEKIWTAVDVDKKGKLNSDQAGHFLKQFAQATGVSYDKEKEKVLLAECAAEDGSFDKKRFEALLVQFANSQKIKLTQSLCDHTIELDDDDDDDDDNDNDNDNDNENNNEDDKKVAAEKKKNAASQVPVGAFTKQVGGTVPVGAVATYGPIQLMSGETALQLHELSVESSFNAGSAVTTVIMTFFNQKPQIVEGELDFPLDSEATVCGYAYEFNGRMVPASIVEKEKARVTFEQEVRRGGATSLVEHTKGSNFKVRVYPLEPNRQTRVSVTFLHPLKASDGALACVYPFVTKDELNSLSISLGAVHPSAPLLEFKEYENFNNTNGRFTLKKDYEKLRIDNPIKITFPLMNNPKGSRLVDYDTDLAYKGQEKNNEHYFLVQDYVNVPAASNSDTATFSKTLVLWDGSYSFAKVDREKDFSVLISLAQNCKSFDVRVFRNTVEPVKSFATSDVEKLIDYLKKIDYDGGTDLAHLPMTGTTDYSAIFLFTDGLSSLSDDLPMEQAAVPVYTFINAPKSNFKGMAFYSRKSGGNAYDLSVVSASEAANNALAASKLKLIRVTGSGCSEIFPCEPVFVKEGEPVTIVGRLLQDAELHLSYGYSAKEIVSEKNIKLRLEDSIGYDPLVPRMWAQKKIDLLELEGGEEAKDELLRLGRKFNIATANTSLLVLTTLEQYLQHKIKPNRDALPDVYDAWQSRISELEVNEKAGKQSKLDKVYHWWQARTSWYTRNYAPSKRNIPHTISSFFAPSVAIADAPVEKEKLKVSLHKEEGAAHSITSMESKEELVACGDNDDGGVLSDQAPVIAKKLDSLVQKPSSPSTNFAVPQKDAEVVPSSHPASESPSSPPQTAAPAPKLSLIKKNKNETVQHKQATEPASTVSSTSPLLRSVSPRTANTKEESVHVASRLIGQGKVKIEVTKWKPGRSYLNKMKAEKTAEKQYSVYLQERKSPNLANSPAFFLDCSYFFFQDPQTRDLGVRILTSIADLKLEDHRLLRIIGNQLWHQNFLEQAEWLLRKVLQLRGEEPQSYRELGLLLADREKYEESMQKLWKLLYTEWPLRFQHIEDEVLLELNRIIWKIKTENLNVDYKKVGIEDRFIQEMPMDLHCTIFWDTDDTCIDLHINEPNGEQCYYGNHITSTGGFSTPDYAGCTAYSVRFFTLLASNSLEYQTSMLREYMIKKAEDGKYKIGCNYYSNYRQDLTGATTIWFKVYANFCTPNEICEYAVLRLEQNSTNPKIHTSYELATVEFSH